MKYPKEIIRKDDREIYVNNAFPLFVSVDNITEELKDIQIINNNNVSAAIATAIVSSGSTITSISIQNSGIGYENLSTPFVAISSSLIKKKDPIYNWKSVSTGISSEYSLNSLVYLDSIVSVGSSGIIGISSDGLSWITSSIGIAQSTTFNSISGYDINLKTTVPLFTFSGSLSGTSLFGDEGTPSKDGRYWLGCPAVSGGRDIVCVDLITKTINNTDNVAYDPNRMFDRFK